MKDGVAWFLGFSFLRFGLCDESSRVDLERCVSKCLKELFEVTVRLEEELGQSCGDGDRDMRLCRRFSLSLLDLDDDEVFEQTTQVKAETFVIPILYIRNSSDGRPGSKCRCT